METDHPSKPSLKEKAAHELREFAIAAAYLFICFMAVQYLKAAVLKAGGIGFPPFVFAVAEPLLFAKFMTLGYILHIGDRFKSLPLAWLTLYRSIVFLVFLFVLNALEEVIVGLVHHRTVGESLTDLGGGSLDQLFATTFIGWLM